MTEVKEDRKVTIELSVVDVMLLADTIDATIENLDTVSQALPDVLANHAKKMTPKLNNLKLQMLAALSSDEYQTYRHANDVAGQVEQILSKLTEA